MKDNEKKPPTVYRDDLKNVPHALTRADYDALMRDRRRNLTDPPIGSRLHGTPVLDDK